MKLSEIKRLEDLGLSKSNLKETLTAVVNQRLYPNVKRKGRVCIYEILHGKQLQTFIETKHIENHKTIYDEIKDAVKKNIIKQRDAKIDLYDQ